MGPRRAMTIRDLVETPSLQLRTIAGAGGLDRPLLWTHVSELDDPAPWLDGGELLMTNGLGLPADGSAQARLVERLDERHAAALGIGVRGPQLRAEMLAEADDRDFPLLHVPVEVPFLSIARMVADANQDSAMQRLLTHVRIFDTLRSDAHVKGPHAIFERLEEISGYDVYLVSVIGAPLISGFRRPPQEVVDALGGDEFTSITGNPAVPGGYAVRVPLEQRPGTFVVALEREGVAPAGLGAVHHIATIAALELTQLYYEREAQRRRGAETLAKLFAGRLESAGVEDALAEAGFAPGAPLAVAALRAVDGDLRDDELHHRLCDLELPHMLLVDRDLFALLPAEPEVLTEALDGLGLRAGISGERDGVQGLSVARKEAMWALERAIADDDGGGAVRTFPRSDSSLHWLPTDIGTLESLVEEILAPVIVYDAEHGSAMLQSLRVFFEHDRRLQTAAAELHVHKHTLSYRLSRVEQITGRDLSSMADMVQLWLALQAYAIVGSDVMPAFPGRSDR
ncbi:PucR family transcriptional regulator [Capillimicrobium parvum]|nr:PucR family transcriptional regulator [Capillimicrobium parvum]